MVAVIIIVREGQPRIHSFDYLHFSLPFFSKQLCNTYCVPRDKNAQTSSEHGNPETKQSVHRYIAHGLMIFFLCDHLCKRRILDSKRECLILTVGPKKTPLKDRKYWQEVYKLVSSPFIYGG